MNIKVNVEIPKQLPINQLNKYIDYTVYNIARITLDFTNSQQRFPRLTGELRRSAIAEGVVRDKEKTYHLGASGVDYAPDVWEYPQSTNWTNPSTYAQWYMTEFKKEKHLITSLAVSNSKRRFL